MEVILQDDVTEQYKPSACLKVLPRIQNNVDGFLPRKDRHPRDNCARQKEGTVGFSEAITASQGRTPDAMQSIAVLRSHAEHGNEGWGWGRPKNIASSLRFTRRFA